MSVSEQVASLGPERVAERLKRSLANLTKQGIDQLVVLVKTRLRRMQYRPGLIDGFLAKTGLDLNLIASRPATTGLPPKTDPMQVAVLCRLDVLVEPEQVIRIPAPLELG